MISGCLDNLPQHRLQATLAQVPLQNSETDSLSIKIAGKTGETIRERIISFKGSGQSHAAKLKRLAEHDGRRYWHSGEKRVPSVRTNLAVNGEALRRLKQPCRNFRSTTKNSVHGAEVQALKLKLLLDPRNLGSLSSESIGRHAVFVAKSSGHQGDYAFRRSIRVNNALVLKSGHSDQLPRRFNLIYFEYKKIFS